MQKKPGYECETPRARYGKKLEHMDGCLPERAEQTKRTRIRCSSSQFASRSRRRKQGETLRSRSTRQELELFNSHVLHLCHPDRLRWQRQPQSPLHRNLPRQLVSALRHPNAPLHLHQPPSFQNIQHRRVRQLPLSLITRSRHHHQRLTVASRNNRALQPPPPPRHLPFPRALPLVLPLPISTSSILLCLSTSHLGARTTALRRGAPSRFHTSPRRPFGVAEAFTPLPLPFTALPPQATRHISSPSSPVATNSPARTSAMKVSESPTRTTIRLQHNRNHFSPTLNLLPSVVPSRKCRNEPKRPHPASNHLHPSRRHKSCAPCSSLGHRQRLR